MSSSMHDFANFIRLLGRGKKGSRDLSQDEARTAMSILLRGECEPIQVGAFLMLLRVKEETVAEVSGFVQAARDASQRPGTPLAVDIDWPSYAGKRRQNPWFLLAAIALAQAGYRIFIHTSEGHTPDRLYTPHALRQMGFVLCDHWDQVKRELDRRHIACMPLQQFCPGLETAIHLKPLLGLRSVANSLVRLINPLDATLVASSIFHPAYGPLHQQVMQTLGIANGLTFKGDGGEIEIRPDANTTVYRINKNVTTDTIMPRVFADKQADAEEALDTQALLDLWHNKKGNAYGEAACIQTMAIMLLGLQQADTVEEAETQARALWHHRQHDALPTQTVSI
ncbi:MAG TPA: glycosyl transferase family protein [Pseudomonadales bacterium]